MIFNEVLELSFRAIVNYIDGNNEKAKKLEREAVKLNEKLKYESVCICTVGDVIPTEVQDRLYKLVS